MSDSTTLPEPFDPAFEDEGKPERLRRRADIRQQNIARPRCASCEHDFIGDVGTSAVVTKEEAELYCGEFVVGDLLCFWCWHGLFYERDEVGRYQFGRA